MNAKAVVTNAMKHAQNSLVRAAGDNKSLMGSVLLRVVSGPECYCFATADVARQPCIVNTMATPRILRDAEFDPRVCTYWLLSGALIMLVCVVTIPLIPFWFIFGRMITGKFLDRISCTLTEQTLIVKKGLFNRIEKTIPLEKITDLALKQGPIMRRMGLNSLSVETAGASGSQSALVALIGIVDTVEFRDTVLAQRDQQNSAKSQAGSASTQSLEGDVLNDIRDTLKRIEARLAKKGG
jgi:putative membrane protein